MYVKCIINMSVIKYFTVTDMQILVYKNILRSAHLLNQF